jgi:asparagine synthase (glutamine-hydrolysing)
VLKHALRRHVPAEVLRAKKRGFNVPVPSWLRGELREMLRDVLSPTALRRVGLFDPEYVQRLIGEHVAMRVDHSRPLWTLLVFMIWHEEWQRARAVAGRAVTSSLVTARAPMATATLRTS